jgi:hypothetical protein
LEQFQHALLHIVRLLQSGDTGLLQNAVLRQIGSFLPDVGRHNPALSVSEVLDLYVHDVGSRLELVRAGSQRATKTGDVRNRGVDVGQSLSGVGRSGQVIRGQR